MFLFIVQDSAHNAEGMKVSPSRSNQSPERDLYMAGFSGEHLWPVLGVHRGVTPYRSEYRVLEVPRGLISLISTAIQGYQAPLRCSGT
jgi:hypothetical protein